MINRTLIGLLSVLSATGFSQNDLDVIRFSRLGVGGTSRFVSMGGAFGAVGADVSAGAYNPSGLALFRKGDLCFSGGFRTSSNSGNIYGQKTALVDASLAFNNFGIAGAWKSKDDPESRHVFAFSNTQVQNFNSSTRMSGYTKNSSIAKDFLNLAEGNTTTSLNFGYEGAAFQTYLLDTIKQSNYYTFIDTKRTILQTRDVITSGRVNDLNFSYAFTYKDRYYIGMSLGFPQVDFTSTTIHTETDDRDSMRIELTPDSYTSTYIDPLPDFYTDKLGFHSMTYEEYFTTSGGGFNLKIGGIMRLNDQLRVGAYYHSPTFFKLTDQYYSSMSTTFDLTKGQPEEYKFPEKGGTFSYRMNTPAKIGLNAAVLFQQLMVLGLDYEMVSYNKGFLKSTNVGDFAGVNNLIQKKYTTGHNVKAGVEVNLDPFKVRVGYSINGSPFGDVLGGDFVRNTLSFGGGYRTKNNFYFDVVWARTFGTEEYYLFNTMDTKADLSITSGMLGLTIGIKF